MAHDPEVRQRAQRLFLAGVAGARIQRETGVSRATLSRWAREGNWQELREQSRALEREAGALVLELTRAARESRDPQQAYAAMQAAKVAGLAGEAPIHPPPAEVAKALLGVLARDAEFRPLLTRRRADVLEAVERELAAWQPGVA